MRIKTFLAGAAAGALMCGALSAWAQQLFTVDQILAEPGRYYGRSLAVSGIVGSLRIHWKMVDQRTQQKVEYASFDLYEPGQGGGGHGRHYVHVSAPLSRLRNQPREGEAFAVAGTLSAPWQIGFIEP